MRVFDFTNALVREPGRSVVHGLRSNAHAVPDFETVRAEHGAYVMALRDAGLDTVVLPPLEEYPDSVFVEDPALVFPEGAILLRPGAATRLGEREHMRAALKRHFPAVLELEGGFVDGGDILVTPDVVFIGLSQRTDRVGADALTTKLAAIGRKTRTVETPPSILHLKTGVSLLDEDTVLATRQVAESDIFAGLRRMVVPESDEAAANALRINDTLFVAAGYPRTVDLLVREGYAVKTLAVSEVTKLDAGLSCMSLRW